MENLSTGDLTYLAGAFGTDKWGSHFYTPHYQHHFEPIRMQRLNILEIGVGGYDDPLKGGESLRMWKQYFPNSNIYAIDIFDKSALQEDRIKIFRGDQVDKKFMLKVAEEIGEIDIIIDDGSHLNKHVIETFKIMFPLLKNGGIYAAEDLQTAYWKEYGGDGRNLNNPRTSMNFFKQLADCLNYEEFPDRRYKPTYYDRNIVELHFYHNLVFVYKGLNNEGSNVVKRDK